MGNADALTNVLGGSGTIMFDGPLSATSAEVRTTSIGAGITIRSGSVNGSVQSTSSPVARDIVNRGTVLSDTPGKKISVGAFGNLTNLGTFAARNGGTLNLTGTWQAPGTIIADGGALDLGGTYSSALVDGLQLNNATVTLGADNLLNTAHLLQLDAASAHWRIDGTISGGTVSGLNGAHLLAVGSHGFLQNAYSQIPIDVIGSGMSLVDSVNASTITMSSGSLNLLGNWHNAGGAIRASGGVLQLGGTFSSSEMASIDASGAFINLLGAMDNTGSTLLLSSSTGTFQINGGTINGGTIAATPGRDFSALRGGLNGIILTAPLRVLNANLDTASLDNRSTITVGGVMGMTGQWHNSGTIAVSGSIRQVNVNGLGTNDGTMTASSQGRINVNQPLTNSGLISASGGTVSFTSPQMLTNLSGTALTGGSYAVNSNSAITLGSATIQTNAATIILSGANSLMPAINPLDTNHGVLKVTSGRAFSTTGNLLSDGLLEIGAASTLTVSGTLHNVGVLRGSGTIAGTVSNDGEVSPGDIVGMFSLVGNYSSSSAASLRFELAGTAAGAYDVLSVTGNANVSGRLNVDLVGGFTPSAGDTFAILRAAMIGGTFNDVDLPALPSGLQWDTSQLGAGVLRVVPEPGALPMLVTVAAVLFVGRRARRGPIERQVM
jgi:hypothetical protein